MLANLDTLVTDNVRILKIPRIKLKQPLAIILVGFLGSGKSTLAARIANDFPLVVLSDEAMSHFLLPYKATFLQHSQKDFLALAIATMERLISEGVSCIYDSNIKFTDDRRIIKQMVEAAGGKLVTIHLTLSKEEALRRIEQQNFQVSRGEKKGFIVNKDLFDYEVLSMQIPSNEEDHLVFESTKPENYLALRDQIALKGTI